MNDIKQENNREVDLSDVEQKSKEKWKKSVDKEKALVSKAEKIVSYFKKNNYMDQFERLSNFLLEADVANFKKKHVCDFVGNKNAEHKINLSEKFLKLAVTLDLLTVDISPREILDYKYSPTELFRAVVSTLKSSESKNTHTKPKPKGNNGLSFKENLGDRQDVDMLIDVVNFIVDSYNENPGHPVSYAEACFVMPEDFPHLSKEERKNVKSVRAQVRYLLNSVVDEGCLELVKMPRYSEEALYAQDTYVIPLIELNDLEMFNEVLPSEATIIDKETHCAKEIIKCIKSDEKATELFEFIMDNKVDQLGQLDVETILSTRDAYHRRYYRNLMSLSLFSEPTSGDLVIIPNKSVVAKVSELLRS